MEFIGDAVNYTYIAIGLGMVISLFLTETLGIMAGGIIVPGYFGLYLHDPQKIIITFIISLLTYLCVLGLSKLILIYGRRRLILSLLIGFFFGYIIRDLTFADNFQLEYIGYIIPGLIASWMDRQGVIRTISVVLIVACIVNLFLMYIYYFDQLRMLNV